MNNIVTLVVSELGTNIQDDDNATAMNLEIHFTFIKKLLWGKVTTYTYTVVGKVTVIKFLPYVTSYFFK
jgi:hypothetical protein